MILFVSSLSNLYEESTKDLVLNIASIWIYFILILIKNCYNMIRYLFKENLLTAYFTNKNNMNNQFADEFLTQFGVLKVNNFEDFVKNTGV